MSKLVTVGDNANIFHDSYSGVTVVKGEKKELSQNQLNSKRIKSALAQGHLIYAEVDQVKPTVDVEAVQLKLDELVSKAGDKVSIPAIAKSFKFDELKALAISLEIEVEEGDTKASIIEAILE